jgi:hypothetical protein
MWWIGDETLFAAIWRTGNRFGVIWRGSCDELWRTGGEKGVRRPSDARDREVEENVAASARTKLRAGIFSWMLCLCSVLGKSPDAFSLSPFLSLHRRFL